MRIAYLTCVYPPYPGGIGVLAQGMASEMAARGYDVEVFTLKPKGVIAAIAEGAGLRSAEGPVHTKRKVRVTQIDPFLRFGHAGFVPGLKKNLAQFDVVHLLYPFFGVAEMIPYLRLRTKAKIIVHHTMDAVAEGALGLVFRLYNQTLMPRIFKHAHQIITLSEDYFRDCDLTAVYASMPDAPPLEFVPNGVDTGLFCPMAKKEFLISNFQYPTIVFASGLDRAHYFKGVHVLLEAMRILKERSVKCRCWIIGDGKMRGEYEHHAREAGLLIAPPLAPPQGGGEIERLSPPFQGGDKGVVLFRGGWKGEGGVEFLGLVPHEKMPEYYRQATVAVVPSTARVECFSIVAAEAQSCGIPAIVSNFPGVRVTVEDGKTGYVARPGDPEELANRIQELVEDPQKARQMGVAGRKRAVEFYSWKKIGEKLEEIYRHVTHNT